ncbi:MrpH family fimbial adhesin [Serratia surfactantfaciens]|uniref:MrpH family fimbial adhesin n=1 Tax=Serratia surfactantfaciens TaxID=2741499 RepID=UPI003EE325B2
MQRVHFSAMYLLLGLLPGLCSAQIYSYVTQSSGSPSDAKYEYVLESWDTDDPSPNPCYQQSQCAIGINHRHTSANTGGSTDVTPSASVVGSSVHPQITKLKTMGELSSYYQRYYPLPISGKTSHVGDPITQECVGLFYTTSSGSAVLGASARLMPSSVCGIAPPPVGVCGIDEQQLDLNHGVLPDTELAGNTARGSLRVVCSQKMNIVMYIRVGSNGRLDLGSSGVYSTLRINGALGNLGYQFTADTRGVTVPITSTLGVTGNIKAGNYSGQSVAILALP